MITLTTLFQFLLHVDKYLDYIIITYGYLTYPILFLIIFCETGFVFTPFLPGDSLIFIAGTFAVKGSINIWLLWVLLCFAAVLGDSVNYWIGSYFGERVLSKSRFFKKEYLDRTKDFYEKHGGKTIVFARFIPIVRTFAPFVAGVGKMKYKKFFNYNFFGGIAWVSLFLWGGYFFGQLEWVKNNITLVTILIIIVSILPVVFEWLRSRK